MLGSACVTDGQATNSSWPRTSNTPLLIEFDDVEGLLAYLAHPQHAAIGLHFVQSAAAALAYDYEIEE